jgi:UPF0755 protein
LNPPKNNRGVLSFSFLVLGGGFLVLILSLGYFFYGLQPSFATGTVTQFKIVKGESFKDIGARLSQAGLLRSIFVFKAYAILTGKAQKFQPGIYTLSSNMSVPEIVSTLTQLGKDEVTVTIPEGSTVKDIDDILEGRGVIEAGAVANFRLAALAQDFPFLAETHSLEGFLFPDTYRFKLNSSPEEVIKRFLNNFMVKAWPLLSDKKNWYEMLTLASFLEREVPDFNDRQIVAGILLKRLRLNIPLQVDATISYAKCAGKFRNCAEIAVKRSDLEFPSPYNTYQRLGWTPTPISNPGQAAIKAATTPQASPYFYYLSAKNTKETIFSKTLEEHNINRAKYL